MSSGPVIVAIVVRPWSMRWLTALTAPPWLSLST